MVYSYLFRITTNQERKFDDIAGGCTRVGSGLGRILTHIELGTSGLDSMASQMDGPGAYLRRRPPCRHACRGGALFLERLVATDPTRFHGCPKRKRSIVLVSGCRECAGGIEWVPVGKESRNRVQISDADRRHADRDGHSSVLGRSSRLYED